MVWTGQQVLVVAERILGGLALKMLLEALVTAAVRRMGLSERTHQRMRSRIEERYHIRFEQLNLLNIAPCLEVPLLIFHDLDDPDVSWASGEAISQHWPGAKLITTKGLGHFRILKDERVLRYALDFLKFKRVHQAASPNLERLFS